MPAITVNNLGIELFYEDTGAPPDVEDYTTVFLLHGTGFHGAIFRRLVPLAAQHSLRLVFINRRDYPGSTAYSDDELKVLRELDKDAHAEWLKQRGLEILKFVDVFVEQYKIPPTSNDGKSGGVAILGWSSGTTTSCSAIANVEELPVEVQARLEQYIRAIVVYDSAGYTMGMVQEELVPVIKGSSSSESLAMNFGIQVSGYYNHPDISSRKLEGLAWTAGKDRIGTVLSMSEENLKLVMSPETMLRSEGYRTTFDLKLFEKNARKALFEATIWPRLQILVLWCQHTIPLMPQATWQIEGIVGRNDKNSRPLKIKMIEGVNHFAHWDDPEKFMVALVSALSNHS